MFTTMSSPRPGRLPHSAFWLSFVVAVGALTLAGCGGTDPAPAPDTKAPQASEPAPSAPESPTDTLAERIQRERWTGDLDGIVKRRYLRVLVVPDKMYFFFDGQQMRGVTYDAVREFETFFNRKMNTARTPVNFVFIPVSREEILKSLADGRGDLAVAGLGITPERLATVDFSDPTRDDISVVPVTGPDTPPLKSLDELAGRQVYVPLASVLPADHQPAQREVQARGQAALGHPTSR